MNCGISHRCSSDLALLWLWQRPAAIAVIQPLAWEPPNAESVALKRQKQKAKKKNEKEMYHGYHLYVESIKMTQMNLPMK